jgi:nucleotide-binding universal stress UspA family protein
MNEEARMKILVAVDGSSPSQAAIDEVAERPWPQPSTVRVVSAVQPYVLGAVELVPAAVTPHDIAQQQDDQAKQLASRAARRLEKPGLAVESVVREGDPRQVIVDEANDWGANLIVMGSHGRTGLQRLLLGSVAQAVVGHARCSVEVVRRPQAATG